MKRFIQGEHRGQSTLLPESLDDYVADSNPVRGVAVFVDELDLGRLDFKGVVPAVTGRPAYHPAVLLKIYTYGYLNRIQSSRRLEHEAQRNVELMWLTGRLMPDFKTIANFRKDNGKAIRGVCRQFVVLCRQLGLFAEALVAIDGNKFKAVNNRDRNFTSAKLQRRMAEIESSISCYLTALDTADRQEAAVAQAKAERLTASISAMLARKNCSRNDALYRRAEVDPIRRLPHGRRLQGAQGHAASARARHDRPHLFLYGQALPATAVEAGPPALHGLEQNLPAQVLGTGPQPVRRLRHGARQPIRGAGRSGQMPMIARPQARTGPPCRRVFSPQSRPCPHRT